MLSAITAGGENCNITEKGFVYSSTNNTPTIGCAECSKIVDDDLNAVLSGLKCNTTYYVRSYATNEKGTGYSTVKSFKTSACSSYTITWNNNGSTFTTTTITQGATISDNLPDAPDACSDTYKTFVGWFTEVAGSESSPSATLPVTKVTASTVPTGNTTYYAVWGNGAAGGEYEIVSSVSELSIGDIVTFATMTGSSQSGKVITAYADGNNWPATDATTDASGKIASDTKNMQVFKLEAGTTNNTWAFNDGSNKYPYAANSSNGDKNYMKQTDTKSAAASFTINIDNNKCATIVSQGDVNGRNEIRYNNTNTNTGNLFSCYASSNTTFPKPYIYRQTSSGATGYISSCCSDKAEVTVTPTATTINVPESGPATTGVTCKQTNGTGSGEWAYSVSPSDGATFDGSTFTATKAGTYTVTATYKETCDKSGSATITVLATPTITLVADDEPADPIVFEDPTCGGNTPLTSKKSVKLQGYNLTGNVTVTVTGDYKIARTDTTTLGNYTTSLTLDKTNEGKINDKYQTIYILSTPPAAKTDATKGTLTITTKGGNTLTVNLSTPTITCTEYKLTFMDRGGEYTTVTKYAGTEVAEPTAPTDVCTEPINYVFDGWAEATVAEGATSYTKVKFPYTMPNNNTTKLYAVYRYADGGTSTDFVKVTTTKDDWTGEYIVVNETNNKALKNTVSDKNVGAADVTITDSKISNPDSTIVWKIKKNGDYYSMYNEQVKQYLYVSTDKTSGADLSTTIQSVQISMDESGVAKIYGSTISRCFSYYSSDNIWKTYSTTTYSTGALYYRAIVSYLYTTSPVCGPHIGLSGDVRITSAKGVRVDAYTKISVRATNLNKNTGGDGGAATAVSIKAESDNPNFKIKRWGTTGDGNDAYSGNNKSWAFATNITAANYEDSLCITYTPTASNTTESATITLTAYRYNGSTPYATNTITVHGHSLPERFVIAAKGTDGWVALPNTLGSNSSATVPNAENINDVVDNTTSPTKLTNAPSTVIYTAAARGDSYKNNSPTGLRFTKDGGQFLQGELSGPKVWLSTTGSQDMQSWTLRTEDFADYEVRLDSDMVKGRYLAYNKDATTERIGHYATYTAIRFLPFEAECTRLLAPANLKVTQVKSSAITLAWDAVAGAIGYAYSTDGGTTWTEMGNVLTYTITGLTAEKAYTIWVKGVVPVGDTDCSYYGTVSATTTNCDDVPQNISYTSDANSITLSWAMSSNTATVQVFSDAEGNTPARSDSTYATSPCTITGLTKATTYYARILANGTCPSKLIEVSTERPQLDVVEWYENKIDVEINTDEKISVLLENQVTKGTGTGKVAEDLFFSKYYEAKGDLKMLGIFNGTDHDIDLTNIRIWGAKEDVTVWTKEGSTNPHNYVNLGKIKQTILSGEEMILFTVGNYFDGQIGKYTKSSEYPNGYTATSHPDNWYLVGVWGSGGSDTNGNLGLTFSGAYSLALVDVTDAKNPKFIDVIGAGTVSAPAHGGVKNSPTCTMDKNTSAFSATKGEDFEGNEAVISTNSFLLVRKNTVVSGAKAVEHNTTHFKTLGNDYLDSEGINGEWVGKSVCAETSSTTASAVLDSISCSYFDYVSTFDYNGYYTTYDSLMVKTFDENGRNPDGTITIEIPHLDTLSCRGLKIIASDESGHVLTAKEYRVPIIVYQSTTTADATVFHFSEDTCKTCDVVVRPNIKLQAKAKSDGGKVEFRNMMVYAKGNFEIPTGVDFTLDNLEMHAKNDTVAYALIDGSLTVLNKITHVKRINSVTMGGAGYHFALPYPCDGTSIRQYNGNSLGKYDVDWVVFYYAGDERAITGTWNEAGTGYNGKSYWRTFPTANFELQPNVAYIIATAGINAGNSLKSVYFPPKASKGYSETTYTESTHDSKTVAVKAYTGAAAELHANDRGWNFIGHPYISMFNHQTTGATGTNNAQVKMGYWEGTKYSETDKVYVNVPQNGVTSYEQDEAANLKMSPFLGYFVQVAGDADAKLTFIKNARELLAAPMMRAASVRDEHAEVALKLTAPSGEFDRTTILVDEAYTVDYEINRDLGKMARAKGLPRFYSISMEGLNEKMCYQALPSAVAENNVPLGFYAYEAGTYTIAIDSTRGDLSAVTAVALKVDGNVVHDLLSGPYTFAVSKARSTDNDSFSVSIQRKAQVTTDVNVIGNSDAVAPVVYTQGHRIHIQQLPLTGRLHIIDAVGRTIVDEQLDGCSERQYTLATDGVYVVRVATDSNVFIVKVAIR